MSSYNLGVNNDQLLHKKVTRFSYKQSESIFSYASSHVGNLLYKIPLSLRGIENVFWFKRTIEVLFNIVFEDVDDAVIL